MRGGRPGAAGGSGSMVPPPMSDRARTLAGQIVAGNQPVYAVAMDGEVVAWNAAAARLLGIPGTRALGLACWEVLGGHVGGGAGCGPDCPALVAARAGRGAGPADL